MNLLTYVALIAGIVLFIIMISARKFQQRQYAATISLVFVSVGAILVMIGFFGVEWNGMSVTFTGAAIFIGAVLGSLLTIMTRK